MKGTFSCQRLCKFKKTKRRTELESFSAHGLTAIVEKYCRRKLISEMVEALSYKLL